MVFPVYELATPAAEPSLTMVDHLTLPSVQLFLERGQRVRPGFHLPAWQCRGCGTNLPPDGGDTAGD